MAGKKPEYEDALGSIFDFIFTNSTKKGKGLKPVRPSGKSPSDDITATLAQIAAAPHSQLNAAGLAVFDEALNKSFIEFHFDKMEQHKGYLESKRPYLDDGAGRVRVRTRELLGFFQAPGATIDKAFKKADAERKWARYTGLGIGIDFVAAGVWAKKNGFSNKDAYRIAGSTMMSPSYISQADAHGLVAENVTLSEITKKLDSKTAKAIANEVRQGGVVNDKQLEKILSVHASKGLIDRSDINKILSDFRDQIGKDAFKGGDGSGFTGLGYRRLLGENFYHRAGIEETPEERVKLQKAFTAVQVMNRLKSGAKDIDIKEVGKDLQGAIDSMEDRKTRGEWTSGDDDILKRLHQYKEKYQKLDKEFDYESGRWVRFSSPGNDYTNDGDFRRLKEAMTLSLQGRISHGEALMNELGLKLSKAGTAKERARIESEIEKELRKNNLAQLELDSLKTLGNRDFRLAFASTLARVRYTREYLLSGAFIGGMLNGTFYNQSISGPGAPGNWAFSSWYRKGVKVEDSPWFSAEVGYETIRNGMVLPREELNPAYALLTNAYYLTPASLVKTLLWNGEGFAYIGWLHKKRTLNRLKNGNLMSTFKVLGIPEGDWKEFFLHGSLDTKGLLMDPKKYYEFMEFLTKNKLGDISNLAIRSQNITQFFAGTVARFSFLSGKLVNSKLYKSLFDSKVGMAARLRGWFADRMLSLSTNSIWQNAVNAFKLGNQGLREVVRAGIRALLASLNLSTGGIMTPIVWVLSEGILWLGDKLIKPTIKIITLVILGILFLIPLLGTVTSIFGRSTLTSQFLHIPPGPCEECIAQNPHAGLYPEPPAETGGEYPPSDSTCPLNFSPQRCTQGPTGNVSHYHQVKKAVDVGTGTGVWHAPSDGRVESYKAVTSCTASGGVNYGGEIVFIDSIGNNYMVMHAKALVSAGSSVRKGDAVAVVETGLPKSDCWTGAHFHLHVSSAGVNQNALDWYNNKLQCNIQGC